MARLGLLVRMLLRIERSNDNPTLCNTCEDLVRQATAAELDTSGMARRELELKGKTVPLTAYVMKVGAA